MWQVGEEVIFTGHPNEDRSVFGLVKGRKYKVTMRFTQERNCRYCQKHTQGLRVDGGDYRFREGSCVFEFRKPIDLKKLLNVQTGTKIKDLADA